MVSDLIALLIPAVFYAFTIQTLRTQNDRTEADVLADLKALRRAQ